MSMHLEIKSVDSSRDLEAFVFSDAAKTNTVRMEVYTGWIAFTFSAGGSLGAEEIVSFVPIKTNVVRRYQPNDLITSTLTATLSAVADDDDESNLFALDRATVKLEPQVFGGVGGSPSCLVLRARVSALNGQLHRIAYQVTTLTNFIDSTGTDLPVDPDTKPN